MRGLLQHGAKMTVSISCNPANSTQKIKVCIDPQTRVDPEDQWSVSMALDIVEAAVLNCPVADKGHRHSNGSFEVCF